jgi:hypothetical protein
MDVKTLLDTIPLSGLSRIVAGPQALNYVLLSAGQMRDVVGFEWFNDAITSLEYGAPPAIGLILGGTFDEEAISAALSARAFEQADLNGVTVWHRFGDGQMNIAERDPVDPFGGDLGMAARIAILPGYLVNTRNWDMVEEAVAAAMDEQDSLADDPNYRALAEAITAPEGVLIQALFFKLADTGFIPDDPRLSQDAPDPTADYGPLMPYALAVLADRQDGNDQVHLIALVYPNATYAADAAEEVARRVRAFTLPVAATVLIEEYGAAVSTWVYESESGAVAVVEVRYPLPENRIETNSGLFIASGQIYRRWMMAMMRREFFLLVVKAE